MINIIVYVGNINYVCGMKIFITGFLQVYCVALNTVLIANRNYCGAFAVGFLLSFIWTFNVSRIASGMMKDRVVYASAAAIATVLGLLTSELFV